MGGRGFSLLEIQAAGLKRQYARTIGIAVDKRRRNRSQEGMARNVRRLKKYMASLVLFPLKPVKAELRDKEKMITYLVQERQALMRMAEHENYEKEAMPYRHKKKIAELVELSEVPDYNAVGTLKSECCIKKHHFKWRRRDMVAARKKKAEAAKAAKKKAKGK